ncbi:hypothetical protein HYPGJ_31458 [Hyphomicrobium sp. GJ21]|uniref:hypothetical protein n=1 Tax=Hyphomicrobium sp. GJ21 TaxID=113574 RepID=UPI000622B5DD|nr:hypothetical protein [Hyphomicrobium sp. GJ21]CEJ87907.1 hypothetical protein HYPGJ_31458 [Hyphomicrobium sp. GJ21]
MKKPDVYAQLLNVMEGYTADGESRGKPIVLAVNNINVSAMGIILVALFSDLEQHMPEEMALDRVRTAVILVFIRWLKLTGITSQRRLRLMMKRVCLPTAH